MKNRKPAFWIGAVIKVLMILFFVFDAAMKVIQHPEAMKGSAELGISAPAVPVIGIMLLLFTLLYALPQTTTFGLLLITAYLGGASATMVIANQPGHPYIFPVIFAIVMWIAQLLMNPMLLNFLFRFKKVG